CAFPPCSLDCEAVVVVLPRRSPRSLSEFAMRSGPALLTVSVGEHRGSATNLVSTHAHIMHHNVEPVVSNALSPDSNTSHRQDKPQAAVEAETTDDNTKDG
ncbi:MAG: hypothetical protein COA48_07900, partial [Cycloclasticus sp.]